MAEAELEIHAEHGIHGHHPVPVAHDPAMTPFARSVAAGVSVLGVILAVVTIASHRAHTAAVIQRTEANDQWAYYQAKKTREYVADFATGLIPLVAGDRGQALTARFGQDRGRYQEQAAAIQREAQAREQESVREESRALQLDISEGFFELGLVLCSLYFLARRHLFPILGAIAAAIGAGFGLVGWLS